MKTFSKGWHGLPLQRLSWPRVGLFGRGEEKKRTRLSAGPWRLLGLDVRGIRRSLVLRSPAFTSLIGNVRGDRPGGVLGLQRARVVLAEPAAERLRVDVELCRESLGGDDGIHSDLLSGRATRNFVVHRAIVSCAAARVNAVQCKMSAGFRKGCRSYLAAARPQRLSEPAGFGYMAASNQKRSAFRRSLATIYVQALLW